MKKKLLLLMLALLLVVSSVTTFSSCDEDELPNNDDKTEDTGEESETPSDSENSSSGSNGDTITPQPTLPTETVEPKLDEEDLPETFDGDIMTFKGKQFNVLTKSDGAATSSFNVVDFTANIFADSSIQKAVRERNQKIEANFDVKLRRISQSSPDAAYKAAQSAIAADSKTYDAFMLAMDDQVNLACGGGLLDLYTAPYMDIEADYWDNGFVETMQLAGGVYFVAGDCNTVDKDTTYCVLFNENLLNKPDGNGVNWDAKKLYSVVKEGVGKNGGFTIELLNRLAKDYSNAIDDDMWNTDEYSGDGNYGLYTQSQMTRALLLSADIRATKSSNDVTGIASNVNSTFEQAVVDVQNYFGAVTTEKWFCNLDVADAKVDSLIDFWGRYAKGSFKANRATFFMCHIGMIDDDMPVEHGVLPVPKLYDTQQQYGNSVQFDNCLVYSVMNRTEALNEKSSYILEVLAYYSSQEYCGNDSLNYVYYKEILKAGIHIDEEDAWYMLDLIFENRKFDVVAASNMGGVWGNVISTTSSTGTFSASQYTNLDILIKDKLKTLVNSRV